MSHSPSPNEAQLRLPEPETPYLVLVLGDGEGPEPGDARPQLYEVPDPAVQEAVGTDADDTLERRESAAELSGRMASGSAEGRPEETIVATSVGLEKDEQRYKSGGGSWLIREHMKKLEKEAREKAEAEALSHEDSCNCKICTGLG